MSEAQQPAATDATPAPAPVTESVTPTPRTDADYAAAAIAALGVQPTPAPPAPEEVPAAPVETAEAPAEETKEEAPAEEPKSKLELRALSAVARAQRELRQKQAEWEREKAELEPILAAKRAGDPIAYLMAGGMTYEQATEAVISGKTPQRPQAPAVAPEVAELRAKVEAMERAALEAQQRAQRAEFQAMAMRLAGDGEEFELFRAYAAHPRINAQQRVFDVLAEHYQNTGSLPADTEEESIRIAMEHVEQELERDLLGPGLTSRKVKGRLVDAGTKRDSAGGPQATSGLKKQPTSTLTNAQASSAPVRPPPARPRTDEDYQSLAAAVLESKRSR